MNEYKRVGPKPGTKAARIIEFVNANAGAPKTVGITAAYVLAHLFEHDPVYSEGDKDRARRSIRATMTALAHQGFLRKVSPGRFAKVRPPRAS